MRSPLMLPTVALIDPELTMSMPPATTASTGLDALTQLLEAFVSNKANPLTDGICQEGLKRAAKSLKTAYAKGDNIQARTDMCIASLFGGLGLANAKLGAVHGFAGPLGGMYDAPHGAICAQLLAPTIEANVQALQARQPKGSSLARFDQVARILTGIPTATSQDAVQWIGDLCNHLQLAPLRTFGISIDHAEKIVEKAAVSSSMQGNPIQLTKEELTHILHRAL